MTERNLKIDEVIIYLRKSRSDDPGTPVEEVLVKHEEMLQETSMQMFGQKIPEDAIFREIVSGETISARPVMQNVMRIIESGSKKAVLVVEPQRLTRGDLEDCGRVINAFRYTNTIIVTPPKTYDLTEEYDRKFFEMELLRGNDYLEYTKKILNRGRIASVKKGNFIGSIPPYGYKKVKTGHGKDASYTLEIIPEQADTVRLMYELYLSGDGFRAIATKLDALGIKPLRSAHWNPASISDMIENPVYLGKIRWDYRKTVKKIEDGKIIHSRPNNSDPAKYILVDGKHPAIIDQETFDAAAERRGKTPKIRMGTELNNPFAGIVTCKCGFAMSLKKQKSKSTGTISESMVCDNQHWCHTKSVMYRKFLERVNTSLEDAISDFEVKMKSNDDNSDKIHQSMILNLGKELDRLKERDARQKDAYEDGVYSKEEYALRNAKVQEKIAEITLALEDAKNSIPEKVDYLEKIQRFTDCLNALNDSSVSAKEKNTLLKSCIEKIVYHNDMKSQRGIGRYVDNIFRLEIFLRV